MARNVTVALDILLEEIEGTIDELADRGARAFKNKDLASAAQLADRGTQITEFRQRAAELLEEWNRIASSVIVGEIGTVVSVESNGERIRRLGRGLRTPLRSYYHPILQALVIMGGNGTAQKVLDRVERSMKTAFNQYDLQRLPSGTLRWEKTANYARLDMVEQGLLSRLEEQSR
ncbi:MAG: hypothetical protein HYX94_12630 [Chloroflexi bacterium]|nr:hypothetical protein [Chloroflexota bacterium]